MNLPPTYNHPMSYRCCFVCSNYIATRCFEYDELYDDMVDYDFVNLYFWNTGNCCCPWKRKKKSFLEDWMKLFFFHSQIILSNTIWRLKFDYTFFHRQKTNKTKIKLEYNLRNSFFSFFLFFSASKEALMYLFVKGQEESKWLPLKFSSLQ